MIDRLYEEVLLEEGIKDWIIKNKNILKQLGKELSMMVMLPASAGSMGIYVSNFLEKNFPNLPEQTLSTIAQFIANNPQVLDFLKG